MDSYRSQIASGKETSGLLKTLGPEGSQHQDQQEDGHGDGKAGQEEEGAENDGCGQEEENGGRIDGDLQGYEGPNQPSGRQGNQLHAGGTPWAGGLLPDVVGDGSIEAAL